MTAPHAPSQGVLSCLCPLLGKVSHWSPSQQATEDTLTTHPPSNPHSQPSPGKTISLSAL